MGGGTLLGAEVAVRDPPVQAGGKGLEPRRRKCRPRAMSVEADAYGDEAHRPSLERQS